MNCRMCNSENLKTYIDLGAQPPSDEFLTKEQLSEPVTYYPLEVALCIDCGLSQLTYVVPPEKLYQNEYPYESSTTEGGKKHYFDFAEDVVKRFNLTQEDLTIDIGSNVGVLLEGFRNNGTKILGIDPAPNIVKIANERGIPTVCEFFNSDSAEKVEIEYGKASVITGTNVFAHVDNLKDFMRGIKLLLKEDGIFIFESPTILSLVKENAYSSIYSEHLSYLSLSPVIKFLNSLGFDVFDVEFRELHEGSIRVFITRKGKRKIEDNVYKYLAEEETLKIHEFETMERFGKMAQDHRKVLREVLSNIKAQGKTIAAVSMPAKGQTLINYCGLKGYIDFGTEKSKLKIGKYSPGANILVEPDNALLDKKVDFALLLAWNFADEIIKNNKSFSDAGGHFIIPFPSIRVV